MRPMWYQSKTEEISIKQELLNQFQIAFRLIELWYSSDQLDVLSIDARWALLSIEPAYVLPALVKFLQQMDIPVQKAEKIIDRIIVPFVTSYPFSYESNYKEISDWLLDIWMNMPSKPESVHFLAMRALRVMKRPTVVPVFINLVSQGWSDCIDPLAEMELGEYASRKPKTLYY
ncbi:MAG: hypothetical protein IPL28_08390 [Chloroflexi bacterium]|nr:hypothetical protein [Chloroflexota bacterium]